MIVLPCAITCCWGELASVPTVSACSRQRCTACITSPCGVSSSNRMSVAKIPPMKKSAISLKPA